MLLLLKPTPTYALPVSEGLTLWFEAETNAGTTGTFVSPWVNQADSGMNATRTGTQRPTILEAAFPTGQNGVAFDGSNDVLLVTAPTSIATDIFPTTEFTAFTVFIPRSFGTNAAEAWDDDTLWATGTLYAGVTLNSAGPTVQPYNFDTNTDSLDLAVTANTAYLVTARHESGLLYGSLNGGTESSTASGSTGDLSDAIIAIGSNGSTGYADVVIGALLVYNRALTTQETADINAYLIAKYLGATDENPITASIYDRGHTATLTETATATFRSAGATATLQDPRT